MKKLFSLFVMAALSAAMYVTYVITLTNQMIFEGKVLKIKECMVKFQAANGNKYWIPADDIFSVQFEDPMDAALIDYMLDVDNPDKCLLGRTDAEMHHGKKGAHVIYGFLSGPFAMLVSAASTPSPYNDDTLMLSKNNEIFDEPAYLNCYRKKATGQNIGMEAIGWAGWILLLLI
jgi:hypothetical protein